VEVDLCDAVPSQIKWAKTVHPASVLPTLASFEAEDLGVVCRGVDRAVGTGASSVFCGVTKRGVLDLGVVAAKYCALKHNLDRVAVVSDRKDEASAAVIQGDENFLLVDAASRESLEEIRRWAPDMVLVDCARESVSRLVAEVVSQAASVVVIAEAETVGYFFVANKVGASASEGTDERGRKERGADDEDAGEDEEEIGIEEPSEKEKPEGGTNVVNVNDEEENVAMDEEEDGEVANNEEEEEEEEPEEEEKEEKERDSASAERKRERAEEPEEDSAPVMAEDVELPNQKDVLVNEQPEKRARVEEEEEEEAEVNILEDDKPAEGEGEGEEDSQEGTAREGPDLVMDFDLSEKSFTEVEKSEKSGDKPQEKFVAPASVVAPEAERGGPDVDELDMEEINALIGEELGDIAV
jgi:hypothetical protein